MPYYNKVLREHKTEIAVQYQKLIRDKIERIGIRLEGIEEHILNQYLKLYNIKYVFTQLLCHKQDEKGKFKQSTAGLNSVFLLSDWLSY